MTKYRHYLLWDFGDFYYQMYPFDVEILEQLDQDPIADAEVITGDLAKDTLESIMDGMGFGWISVDDRLPDNHESVIVWCPDIKYRTVGFWNGDTWWTVFTMTGKGIVNITHWMPLPEPPEAQL